MMKKKIWWAGALSVAIAASGVYGYNAVQAAGSGQTTAAGTQAATKQQQQLIGMEKAEQLALAAASGKVESIDIDRKKGKLVYDVEIQQNNRDVDVWIDAYTGKSLGVRADQDDDDDDRDNLPGNLIGAGKASAIAVKHAKGGTAVEVDLDQDDGRWVYDVEVKTANGSSDVEVHAISGKVIKAEYEKYDDHDDDDDDHDDDYDDHHDGDHDDRDDHDGDDD
ncbi:PepSY domain-containing protein [Paenibacillus sp. p3-SID867]|uniref:PepSY domain-containing protein n=1 Tax=Paenibacillus sp. p3-SID867 TaxID=2916363 RepID=UPI0021A54585|nr:PepSY domain-containing protein [Paenibacillus sp. p3-SID867]MCT1402567.1 PepSY domain-containing protein [Paenibacillus sp. p3-SID867]